MSTKKVISADEWMKKLDSVAVDKKSLNALVLNFLAIEGFKDAAETFAREAKMPLPPHLDNIKQRMDVRNAISTGNIADAVVLLNNLNPEILDSNPSIYFHLQQQKLIEFIRNGDIVTAVEFAQEELAPRGEENPEFLEELERTMSLLAFDPASSPVADLLHMDHRQKVASEVNSAILTSFSQDKDPKLPGMLKMLVWAQNELGEKVSFPRMRDFVTGELEDPAITNQA